MIRRILHLLRHISRFFNRHQPLAIIFGWFVALIIAYLAVPEDVARPDQPHSTKGTV